MPDGDKVHKGLAWKYQNAYKQICDGQYKGEDLADAVVPAVLKDIQSAGDEIIQLLQEVAKRCQRILDVRMFEDIDWQQEAVEIDRLARPIYVGRRLKTLAVEACKELLRDLRYEGHPAHCYKDLLEKYMWNIYKAQFVERVPLSPKHYREVSKQYVRERLEEMRPYVKGRLLQYVDKVYRENTVHCTLRRRSISKRNYDIDTDLSTVGV